MLQTYFDHCVYGAKGLQVQNKHPATLQAQQVNMDPIGIGFLDRYPKGLREDGLGVIFTMAGHGIQDRAPTGILNMAV